jgi:hypothetical protein
MDENSLRRQLQNGRIYFNVQVMNLSSIDHLRNDPTCKNKWISIYHNISKRFMITWQTSNTTKNIGP